MKARRHMMIARLLRERDIPSQAALAAALRKAGERVTQATLSRDLEELRASKVRTPDGGTVYRLPEEPPGDDDRLRRMLIEFVTGIETSGSMVVLRTPPGGAQPVARALDTAGLRGVIGTVAGDDTILIVCREGVKGRTVARRLESMSAGLKEASG